MENLININKDVKIHDNENFTEILNRKKRNNKTKQNFGENETDDFGIWLYLYRIKRHKTAEKIERYLKDKESF